MKLALITLIAVFATGCSITCKHPDPSGEMVCNTYQLATSCPAGEVEDTANECTAN